MISLVLGGCQSGTVQLAASPSQEAQPVPNVPYSNGPTTPPGVKGPNQAFPGSAGITPLNQTEQNRSQAMTETEAKTFTLN